MEKILNESNDVEIRLVDGDLVDDFKNKENPSLYLSRNLKLISPAKTMDRTDDKRVAARICKRVVISFLLRDD